MERDKAKGKVSGRKTVVLRGDSGYPEALERLQEPPESLYIVGEISAAEKGVAIIGSRKATPYGVSWSRKLAMVASEIGLSVIAGGSFGCAAAAHRACVELGTATLAVLGGGCDRPYPAANAGLFQEIVDVGGALVSEQPWDVGPHPWMMRRRLRTVAALSLATVVVECGLPSSDFSLAEEEIRLGRPVMAVPGPLGSPLSSGPNALIELGARPIFGEESFARLIDELVLSPFDKTQARPSDVERDLNVQQALLDRIAAENGIERDEEGLVVSDFDLKPDEWASWDEATCMVAAITGTCASLGYEATRSGDGRWSVRLKNGR